MSEENNQALGEAEAPQAPCCPLKEPSRRAAMVAVVGGVSAVYVGGLAYPVYKYLATAAEQSAAEEKVKEVSLDKADELAAGSAMTFKFGGRPALLIHHADNTWTAMTAVCTHLGCTVAYEAAQDRVHCACHGGVYDAKTGANVSGPPPKPLVTYQVQVNPGKVVVSRA